MHSFFNGSIIHLFTVLALALPGQALAGSFKVVPVKLNLDASRKKTALIKVINEVREKLTLQISVKKWRQDEMGVNRLEPTKDILFFPRLFTIAGEAEQNLRIAYRGEPVKDLESAYRLSLEELPVAPGGENVVRMLLKITMPIFILPKKEKVSWRIQQGALEKAHARIPVSNTGNRHIQVGLITANGLDESGNVLFSSQARGWYVFPVRTKSFFVPIPADKCLETRKIVVKVKVGLTSQESEFPVMPDETRCLPPSKKEIRGEHEKGK